MGLNLAIHCWDFCHFFILKLNKITDFSANRSVDNAVYDYTIQRNMQFFWFNISFQIKSDFEIWNLNFQEF